MPTNMTQKLGSLYNQPHGIPQLTDDKGVEIFAKNANAIILGGPTKEGGNVEVYRDDAGNLQLSFYGDAASNTTALSIYGGVVCLNYLTVGQATLDTAYPVSVNGNIRSANSLYTGGSDGVYCGTIGLHGRVNNQSSMPINICVTSGTGVHTIPLQIDSNDVIVIQGTGTGVSGFATDLKIGLYGTTPTLQAAHIADPAESTAGNNAAIDSILAALRGIGLIAT